MRKILKAAVAATALGAASLAAVQPAMARDHTGAAVAAGIIGLGVGAAIASSGRGYDYGYGDGYYAPSYGYAPVYGYEPAYYGGYYGQGYYGQGYYRQGYRDGYRHDRGYRGDDRGYRGYRR